jgi:hypothetical protein
MPPSDIRSNSRPTARAIERPREVLPTPGGPTKSRIGLFESGPQFHYGKRLKNALLYVFKPIVIFIKYFSGLGKIEFLRTRFSPWQLEDVFKIRSDNVIIGCSLRELLHPL